MYEYYSFIDENGNLVITEVLDDDVITGEIIIKDASRLDTRHAKYRTFDSEADIWEFIHYERKAAYYSNYRDFSLLGYEKDSDHVVKIYYNIYIYNT